MNLDDTIKRLENAMTVTAAMALRQESRLEKHAEWLAAHEDAMTPTAGR
jgi:hypothetical protein